MTTKPETSAATNTTIPPPVVTKCGNCNVEERWLLHAVRSRTGFRRLCTSCVLKLHPQSFCPTCFVVYDRFPPQNVTTCFKCYSYSHTLCIGPHAAKPYVCPTCANPNGPNFFTVKTEELEGGAGKCRAVDKKAAAALLAAATIGAASINKVAANLKADAASKAKEAVTARKKAREALEHVAYLVTKEKEKEKAKCRDIIPAEVSGSGPMIALDRNHRVVGGNGGVGAHLTTPAMAVQNRIANQRGADVVDGATEGLSSMNAVDLKGKERLQGFRHNGVPVAIEDRPRVNSFPNNHAIVQKSEGSSGLTQFNSNTPRGENVKIGPLSIFNAAVDQSEHMPTNHGREDNVGSQKDM